MGTLDLEHMKQILVSMFGDKVFETVGGFANVDDHKNIILNVTKDITDYGHAVGFVFLYPFSDHNPRAAYSLQQKDFKQQIHMFLLNDEEEMKNMLFKYFDNRLFQPSFFRKIFNSFYDPKLFSSQQPAQSLTKQAVEQYLRSIFDHEFYSRNVKIYEDHINLILPNKKIYNQHEYISLDIVVSQHKIICFYCDFHRRFASTECASLDDLRTLLLRIFDEYAQIKVIDDHIPETLAELHAKVAVLETRFNDFIFFANSGNDGIKRAAEKNGDDITTLSRHLLELDTLVREQIQPGANQAFQYVYSRLDKIESFLNGHDVGSKRPASATTAVRQQHTSHRSSPPHTGGNSMDMSGLREALSHPHGGL